MVVSDFSGSLEDCKMWSFDGSSTQQAEGGSSDCLLEPVSVFPDPDRLNAFLVMCEVLNSDGSPHISNGRATIEGDDDDFWFGYEQEYFLWDPETNLPYGFPRDQTPQGQFYCSVGASNAYGREVIESHLDMCLDAGINVRESTPKSQSVSGSSRSSPKAQRTQEIRFGSQGIWQRGMPRSMGYPLIGIQSPWGRLTGTAQGCT